MPTLILLGAGGGMLRGLIEAYNRFLEWQSDRRVHRARPGGAEAGPPAFQGYFDPVADPVAAVVHAALGAGAAVLLGTTGQISGAYAAFVVGISAPVILTQLGRIQSVSELVTEAQQTAMGPGASTGTEEGPRFPVPLGAVPWPAHPGQAAPPGSAGTPASGVVTAAFTGRGEGRPGTGDSGSGPAAGSDASRATGRSPHPLRAPDHTPGGQARPTSPLPPPGPPVGGDGAAR
ncbi:hypothetical protein [Streptomyces sp. NPDC057910]|uniref:hypothetical protein n=2 Tax=unclassified Streptomyces TaxID=2593676 RepID=UPI0036E6A886